ncbi:MAG: VirB4 family type IV secretion system protein, partial [Hyphomicrobiaceae bacterium]
MLESKSKVISERARKVRPVDLRFYRHMPYLLEVGDDVVRTRGNAFNLSMQVLGPDGATSNDIDLVVLREQFAKILDGLDDRFSFYVHRLMRPADLSLARIPGDGFASDMDDAWSQEIKSRDLKQFMVVLTIVRGVHAPLKVPFFSKAARRLMADDTHERVSELREVASLLETALPVTCQRLKISDGSLLGFYSGINTGQYRPEYRGQKTLIAEDVANVSPRFFKEYIEFEDGFDKTRYGAVLVVKRYSNTTFPGFLDILDARDDMVISHSFTPIENLDIAERAKLRIQQMRGSEDVARTIEAQLLDAADAVESGLLGFGDHQFSITIFADTRSALDQRVAELRGAASQAGIRLIRERSCLEASFFATHPGNMEYCARSMTVSTITFADSASFHATDLGTEASRLPWRTPVTIFETAHGTAHRFSFHSPGDPKEEPTNGHTLVLGPSEGGKTTTTLFIASQVRRVGGRLFVFDKDNAMEMGITALGGQYAGIKAGQATGLNPLLSEDGPRGEAWLLDWLSSLLESTGANLTPRQSEALKDAVRQNCAGPDRLRNFENFRDLIGDVKDDRDLAMRIAEWGPDGRYGWVFGHADTPLVDFAENPVTAVDMTEVLKLATERTAVLSYLFRRIELLMEDKVPTVILIDEASVVLDDAFFAKRLSEWLVTARKKNVVVVMMT